MQSIINQSVQNIDKKHSGKFLSHLNYDTNLIQKLVTDTVLLATKDVLTLIGLIGVMFYQNWKLAIFAILMIPLATVVAKSLGSANPHNVLKALLDGLKNQSSPKFLSALRGKNISEIIKKREN